jgi:hypothetical protein
MSTKNYVYSTIALITFIVASSPALAVIVKSNADLPKYKSVSEYIFSSEMFENMRIIGIDWDKKLSIMKDCNSGYVVKPMGVMILSPVDFPQNKKHPVQGSWQVRYQLERCGEVKIYNASFSANPNGSVPNFKQDYPGETLANPKLFNDAQTTSKLAAVYKSGLKDTCDNVEILDTKISERPHNLTTDNQTNGWSEIWIYKVCAKEVEVPLTFTYDVTSNSTKFDIKVK